MGFIEQADGGSLRSPRGYARGGRKTYHRWLKRAYWRWVRRHAKRDPEGAPRRMRYRGYET